eukprot:8036770-Pyramimonas_sp.AAC.1
MSRVLAMGGSSARSSDGFPSPCQRRSTRPKERQRCTRHRWCPTQTYRHSSDCDPSDSCGRSLTS